MLADAGPIAHDVVGEMQSRNRLGEEPMQALLAFDQRQRRSALAVQIEDGRRRRRLGCSFVLIIAACTDRTMAAIAVAAQSRRRCRPSLPAAREG